VNKTDDITRGTVQKSVCVLTTMVIKLHRKIQLFFILLLISYVNTF